MLPVVTPDEMRRIDAAAPESLDVLIGRAAAAVTRAAIDMMGGTYGRTIHVIVGPGNNGADGRTAAGLLAGRGARVHLHEATAVAAVLPDADLVIDAAYGTGFRGQWSAPDVGGSPVLAVDIPSGVDALTGAVTGRVIAADRTVTFAALKPGHLLGAGRWVCGEVELVDIGLDVSAARAHLVQGSDVAAWLRPRPIDAHKWRSALRVIGGSAAMQGAPALVSAAAMRSGAGIVHLSVPGQLIVGAPVEVVQHPLPAVGWATAAVSSLERFHALVIGPGMGRDDATAASIRDTVLRSTLPLVVDGDGLFALSWNAEGAAHLLRRRSGATVLTPHDGEFTMLAGEPPSPDRLVAARRLAHDTGTVVLLKGPTTVIAAPDGTTWLATGGDERLATAGSGDVLAGVVGAFLATGVPALEAAVAAAWVHGEAAQYGPRVGLVASDLPDLLPLALGQVQ